MSTVSGPQAYQRAVDLLETAYDPATPMGEQYKAVAAAQAYADLAKAAATIDASSLTANGYAASAWGAVLTPADES